MKFRKWDAWRRKIVWRREGVVREGVEFGRRTGEVGEGDEIGRRRGVKVRKGD